MGLKVHLFIESRCNFRCKHCFTSKSDSRLSARDVKAFLDWISSEKIDSINIAGSGNPLLNPEFEEIIKVSSDYGRVTLNFRGDIDEEKLDILYDHDVKVYYSIDSLRDSDEFHGVENMNDLNFTILGKLVDRGIETYIRTTIARQNYFDVLRIISMSMDMSMYGWIDGWYGVPYVPHRKDDRMVPTDRQLLTVLENTMYSTVEGTFMFVHPVSNAIFPEFGDTYKEMVEPYCWTCGFGKKEGRICLKEDGRIYGCPFDIDTGNIKVSFNTSVDGRYFEVNRFDMEVEHNTVPFNPSLDIDSVFDIFRTFAEHTPLPEKCSKCWMYEDGKCKGGCIVSRRYYGDVACPIPAMDR